MLPPPPSRGLIPGRRDNASSITWSTPSRLAYRALRRCTRAEQRENERRREAAAAAENRKLVSAMLDACGQNIMTSADFDDLRAVKSMMAVGVTLDRVLSALKLFTPKSRRLALESWRDGRLLKAVAESFMLSFVPAMIESWSKASAKAPEKPVQKLKPLAGTSEPATPQARPSDARVRHMRERIIAQVPSRGALADKSATRQLAGGQLIPR